MADIELVIKIPDEQYSLIMQSHRNGIESFVDKETMMYAIKNGTPLPKGHWIPKNSFLLKYRCSVCGWESEKYNYCPNCRAKMVEPQESEGAVIQKERNEE